MTLTIKSHYLYLHLQNTLRVSIILYIIQFCYTFFFSVFFQVTNEIFTNCTVQFCCIIWALISLRSTILDTKIVSFIKFFIYVIFEAFFILYILNNILKRTEILIYLIFRLFTCLITILCESVIYHYTEKIKWKTRLDQLENTIV